MPTHRPAPVRVRVCDAAAMLSCSPRQVWRLIARGVLRGYYPDGRGRGKRCYLLTADVVGYATRPGRA